MQYSSTCFTCSTWFLQSEMPSLDDAKTRRHVKLRYCFGDNRPTRRIRRVRPPILRPSSCEGGGRALARNRVRTHGRSHSARDCERKSDGVLGFGSHGAYYIKNFPRREVVTRFLNNTLWMLPPALGVLRTRVPPIPGRHAPGSMEKIKNQTETRPLRADWNRSIWSHKESTVSP